jgi:hypothetical protein
VMIPGRPSGPLQLERSALVGPGKGGHVTGTAARPRRRPRPAGPARRARDGPCGGGGGDRHGVTRSADSESDSEVRPESESVKSLGLGVA